jgi:hypothetical protein
MGHLRVAEIRGDLGGLIDLGIILKPYRTGLAAGSFIALNYIQGILFSGQARSAYLYPSGCD